tara:strand:- start:155 stop:454 length:300 start_codon:yes stop_codon:yes gene_type:complete
MGHITFLTITYTSLSILLVCILFSGKMSKLLQSEYGMYFMWLYLLTIGELITMAIFIMYYQEIYYKRGKRGRKGNKGNRGMTGRNADCDKCEVMLGNNI